MQKIIIGAIIGAVISILFKIGWDVYSGNRSLEVRLISSITILEKDPIIDELTILYKDKPIKKLTKIHCAIINNGQKPIIRNDIETFPIIDLGVNSRILSARVIKTDPPNIECRVIEDSSSGKAVVDFSLLNPEDIVEFDIYFAGSIETPPSVSARIIGVKKLAFIDQTIAPVQPSKKVGFWIYIILFYCLLSAIAFPIALFEYMKQKIAFFTIIRNPRYFENMTSPELFKSYIQKNMPFIGDRKIKSLLNIARDNNTDWKTERKPKLINMMSYYIREETLARNVLCICTFMVIIGLLLVKWKFFT